MRVARRPKLPLLLSALACAVTIISCGGDSTGPGGGSGGITVSPATDSLALGASVTLAASDASGHPITGSSVFWNTENAAIATVSASGVVTGIAVGTVRIAASSSGKSGFATITVVPQGVASVRVTPLSAAIKVGETVHLQAEPLDAHGNVLPGRAVTWSSASDAVATVDNTGLVTGASTGATTITATSEGKTGTAGIAVGAAVAASITVAPTSVSITTGQTSQLTATVKDANGAVISGAPVSWSVDNGVAQVSSTGLVTGQATGTATVTATSGSVSVNIPVTVTLPPANAVIVSPSSVALLVTERQQMTAVVTDAGGHPLPGQTVTWSSNNTGVAAVGSTGLVIAAGPGSATITATSGSVSGTATVTVSLVPVRRVVVTPDALSFTQGDAGTQLTVTLLDSAGGTLTLTGRPVSWSSNQPSVATVSNTGFVTPGAAGQAVITVTAIGSGLSATATVTVTPVPVSTVTISPSLDTLVIGQQVQLTAATLDASGNPLSGRLVIWDGSNDAVALVTSTGKVSAQSAGTMTVTATSEGKTGTATIVVQATPVASVTISPTTQTVVVGAATPAFTAVTKDGSGNTLTGRTVTWASSNTAVATIDANSGVATGVSAGTTTITATSEGITSNSATLTVTAVPVASVTLSPTSQSVDVGSTVTFTATPRDASNNVLSGRTVIYSSSDPSIGTINSSSGVATGVAQGSVTIGAISEGKTGTASLTVNPAPVGSVTVSPATQTIIDGNTATFSATLMDGQGNTLTGRTVAWTSSDNTVATIDNTGLATSTGPGTTTITATSEGISGTATLQVDPVLVTSVVVTPPEVSVSVGQKTQLTASVLQTTGHGHVDAVAWSTSDGTIAVVDPKGVVTGVAPGSATITATVQEHSGTSAVTVTP